MRFTNDETYMTGRDLPNIKAIPGPESLKLSKRLKCVESPNVTFIGGAFPIFWNSALGANVIDEDGNIFIDFGSAFGVQNVGHSHPRVVGALERQSKKLMHGMGDVHPTEVKVLLAEKLRDITPGDLSQTIFSSSGSEAVESAIKTACMHTKKSGVIAFEGAYHGLTYGALAATHRYDFKESFLDQIGRFVTHIPFPDPFHRPSKSKSGYDEVLEAIEMRIKDSRREAIGAVLLEPVQGRGGVIVPPKGFFPALRQVCDAHGMLLIFDEIMTGFGRTGRWFASEHEGVVPDLLILGKGMTGGFPISACVGSEKVMASWGISRGEAIHTSTFLGSPLGAACALETINILEDEKLIERSDHLGKSLLEKLKSLAKKYPLMGDVRGQGLLIGVELVENGKPASEKTARLVDLLLRQGIIMLPSGPHHNVLSLTPPLVISDEQTDHVVMVLDRLFDFLEKEHIPHLEISK